MDFATFLEKYWKVISGAFVALVTVGIAVALISGLATKKEQQAQSNYFLAEKKYFEIKGKTAKNSDPTGQSKGSNEKLPADYTEVKADFEKVMADFPGSKAAQMSAVYLSDILASENKKDQALATLQKAENNDSGLINTLVQQQIGLFLADQGKCSEAIVLWQKVIDRKQAQFLHNNARLQQALCYQKMNDSKKAEEILTNLANQKMDGNLEVSSTAKEAEKYLRLILFKKASGT